MMEVMIASGMGGGTLLGGFLIWKGHIGAYVAGLALLIFGAYHALSGSGAEDIRVFNLILMSLPTLGGFAIGGVMGFLLRRLRVPT